MRCCTPVVTMICLKIDGWALRLTVLLQLAIWSAVGIVLLHKGISSLQRRTLESADRLTEEAGSSQDDSAAEYAAISSMERAEDGRDVAVDAVSKQSNDKSARMIVQINRESPLRDDQDHFGSSVTESTLRDATDIASNELPSALLSPLRSSRVSAADRSSEINDDVDNSDNEIPDGAIPANVDAGRGNIARSEGSISQPVSKEAIRNIGRDDDSLDFAGSASSRFTKADEEASMRTSSSSTWEEIGRVDDTMGAFLSRGSRTEFPRRASSSGTTTAIVMIAIGGIMLSVVPIMIILRLLYDRKQARKPVVELPPASREETPPPSYEEVVLMSETPLYSTLFLNGWATDDDGRSSPSPSLSSLSSLSSPSLPSSSSNHLI